MEEPQGAVSDKPQENPIIPVEDKTSPENSEYDSVDSYSENEGEQALVTKARSKSSVVESKSETEGSVILEREEGDGQESLPAKKVDDDEDKKNPQYIPKRGTFYEHDDRTAEDVEEEKKVEEEPEDETDKNAKKKTWTKDKERWNHDKFNELEQAPKNKNELISIYGYDIRNEEGPPRARRRRRYGRGPNKYTRNWEDEEAYTKPPPKARVPTKRPPGSRKNRSQEEFPPLGAERRPQNVSESRSSDSNREEEYVQHDDRSDMRDNREKSNRRSIEKQEYSRREPPRNEQYQQTERRDSPPNQQRDVYQENKQNYQRQQSSASTRVPKPKKEIKDSDIKGFTTKTRQGRGVRTEQLKVLPARSTAKKEPSADFIQSQNFTNSKSSGVPMSELEKDMGHLNVQDGIYKGPNKQHPPQPNINQNHRQGSVPPRLQHQGGGTEPKGTTKRYSSMRQRSLPESATPPVSGFDPSFYPSDYNSAAPPPPNPQPLIPPPPMPNMVPQQVPVTGAPPPMMQAPFPAAAFAPQGPPPTFLQGPPPTFIAAPPQPQIVGYVQQPQPQFTAAPPAFPPYQAPPQYPVAQGSSSRTFIVHQTVTQDEENKNIIVNTYHMNLNSNEILHNMRPPHTVSNVFDSSKRDDSSVSNRVRDDNMNSSSEPNKNLPLHLTNNEEYLEKLDSMNQAYDQAVANLLKTLESTDSKPEEVRLSYREADSDDINQVLVASSARIHANNWVKDVTKEQKKIE